MADHRCNIKVISAISKKKKKTQNQGSYQYAKYKLSASPLLKTRKAKFLRNQSQNAV